MAIACAAADLLSRRALEVDLVFLIEGEAESGSVGFKDAVQRHKVDILVIATGRCLSDYRLVSGISMPF